MCWALSQHAVGAAIVPRDQIGAFTINEAGNKLPWKKDGGMLVTTGIHPKPCQRPGGDMIHKLSIHNKVGDCWHPWRLISACCMSSATLSDSSEGR